MGFNCMSGWGMTNQPCSARTSGGRAPLVLAMIVLFVGAPSLPAEGADSTPVTVDEAVARAEERPALAAVLKGSVAVEHAASEQAGVWPNPVIQYETERIVDGEPGAVEDSASISQSVELSGRRGLRSDAAVQRSEAARQDGLGTLRRMVAETRRRFWELVHQQALHAVANSWVVQLEVAMKRLREHQKAGVVSVYETLQMGQAMRSARTDLGRSMVEREAAWLELLALTGELNAPAGWPRVQGTLVPSESDVRSIAGSQKHPELRAWELREQAAQLDLKAAERGWVPALDLSGGWRGVEEGGTSRRQGFQAGIGLSIPLFDHGQADAAMARSLKERARSMRELWAEDVRRQKRPALERALGLSTLARDVRAKMDAAAEEIRAMAEASWSGGELDVTELLIVHRSVRDDALAVLELEHAARQACVELREVVLGEAP